MTDTKTGFLSGLLIPFYVLYIGFVGVIGSFILMPYEIGGPAMLGLSLALAGGPLIIKIVLEKNRYPVGFMLAVLAVYVGIAYSNRVEVPDAEPDKASAYASAWLEELSSNPDEAFKVFEGPEDYKRWLPGRLAKVDKSGLRVDRVQKFAPEKQEGRGDYNVYHVWFLHPTGWARVGLHQFYDGGPEFVVSTATVRIDAEKIENDR